MKLLEIGDTTIWTITEREGPQRRPFELFPGIDRAVAARHLSEMPNHVYAPATDRLFHTYQSFLIRRPGQNILIDTCVGDNKARPAHFNYPKADFMSNLARAGVKPEDINLVINTHLHVDHCGWNTILVDGQWVPTFPSARYILGELEYEYWGTQTRRGDDLAMRVWSDSALPIVEAGRAELVAMDFRLDDTICFSPVPGHTPGMFAVHLSLGEQEVVFATDTIHHPIQARQPDWSTVFCVDREAAARTRRTFLDAVADTKTIVIPEHFSYPVAGRVVRDNEAFRFVHITPSAIF